MTGAVLRPRTTSEIVDAGFQLTRENFTQLAILAAVITIPGLVLALINAHIAPPGAETLPALWQRLLVMLPLLLLSTCWYFVGAGALVYSSSEAYHGRAVEPGGALRAAFARAGHLIAGNLIAYVVIFGLLVGGGALTALVIPLVARSGSGTGRTAIVALGGMAAVIGGLVWMFVGAARYVNVTAAVMLEHRSALASLKRSAELSQGYKRRILGLLLLGFTIFLVIGIGTAILVQSFLQNPVVVNALSSLVSIALYPLLANILTVLYYDLRIRKEGYDIEELSRRLGADTAPAVP